MQKWLCIVRITNYALRTHPLTLALSPGVPGARGLRIGLRRRHGVGELNGVAFVDVSGGGLAGVQLDRVFRGGFAVGAALDVGFHAVDGDDFAGGVEVEDVEGD